MQDFNKMICHIWGLFFFSWIKVKLNIKLEYSLFKKLQKLEWPVTVYF